MNKKQKEQRDEYLLNKIAKFSMKRCEICFQNNVNIILRKLINLF